MELNHPAAGGVSGAVLLRMDLPDGNAAPLLRQSEVGEQTRQARDRGQSLQAMAEDEVCDPDCRAGGGGVRHGVGGVVRPVQPAGAVDGAVGAARRELRGECGVERTGTQRRWVCAVGGHGAARGAGGDGVELQAAALSPGDLSGADLLILLAANLRVTRFWCRALCPLGALLGAASQWSVFGLHKDAASCDKCNRCLLHCQGGDDPVGAVPWHKAECLMCMNCLDACPHQSLEFRFFRKEAEVAGPNLPRRKVADRAGRGCSGGAAAAGQYGDGKGPRRAADPSAGGAG